MPHLVSHGDVGDRRGDVLAVVEQGDDARVQALQAAPVVLWEGEEEEEEEHVKEKLSHKRSLTLSLFFMTVKNRHVSRIIL